MKTESVKKAQRKYLAKSKQICFRLHKVNDAALIAHLHKKPSANSYIKSLIEADLNNIERGVGDE